MKLFYCCFIIFWSIQLANAQIQPPDTIKNSINETIIYEYDTVYVAPDTIRMVDTIVHFLPGQVKPSVSHWAIAFNYSPYVSNVFGQFPASDTFTVDKMINHEVDMQFQYHSKKFIYSLAVGYLTIHERLFYKYDYLSTGENVSGVYDSLLVKSNGTINNYYNYLNISWGLGRKWDVKKFSFFCNLYFKAGLPVSHQTIYPLNSDTNKGFNDIDYAFSVRPGIAYHLGRKIHWQLSPYFQYSFSDEQKYPLGNLKVMGLSTGFVFFL